MAFGMLGATNANASYMSKCNTLISAWEQCKESGSACTAETTAIVEQCKCHRLRQGEWKLVTAAVGKDGVCAPRPWPPTDVPDPSPPPPPTRVNDDSGKDTGGDHGKGDPQRNPNGGRSN